MGKYSEQSTFIEGQAILAAMEGDDEELERIVEGMTRRERQDLASACIYVKNECEMVNRGSNRR